MFILQQLVQFFSQSPGNLIYHLIILFAAQAIFALAFWQHRRQPDDEQARRLWGMGAGIIFTRLLFVTVAITLNTLGNTLWLEGILPPLEYLLATITLLLIVWGIGPPSAENPRYLDAGLWLGLLIAGILALFLLPTWWTTVQTYLATGDSLIPLVYGESSQAMTWLLYQLGIAIIGLLLLIRLPVADRPLRLANLLILFSVYGLTLLNLPLFSFNTPVPYWLRLGTFVVLPLLTVLTYRHVMGQLLKAQFVNRLPSEQLAEALRLTTPILQTFDLNRVLREAVDLTSQLTQAHFVAIAGIMPSANHLRVVTSQPSDNIHYWELNLADWTALRLALEKKQQVELVPDGLGARQLHELYQELNVKEGGSLLIEPLIAGKRRLGLLLLATHMAKPIWTSKGKALVPYIAQYIAQVLRNTQEYQNALELTAPIMPPPESNTGQLIALEQERDQAREQLETTTHQLQQSENRLQVAQAQLITHQQTYEQQIEQLEASLAQAKTEKTQLQKKLQIASQETEQNNHIIYLEQTLFETKEQLTQADEHIQELEDQLARMKALPRVEHLESSSLSAEQQIDALETELANLREALRTAEEAMALVSADATGLSTEWVAKTITRYSGELEETQNRIQYLENQLSQADKSEVYNTYISLVQELRTPMTSIVGYTDLLLNETVGIITAKQRDLLQRVQANGERMGLLLDQLVQVATVTPPDLTPRPQTKALNPSQTIQSVIQASMTQVQERNLQLHLDIPYSLPPVAINQEAFYQLVLHLISNAIQVSGNYGCVGVRARVDIVRESNDPQAQEVGFLHLSVVDSGGGIMPADRLRVFQPRLQADTALIQGLGETGIGLSMVQTLVDKYGGRIWVDSEMEKGSTFTVLLPLAANEASHNGTQ